MRVNLIPMAGEGKRYKDAGYTIPKPFIDIYGVPMVVRAASALPPADLWIFVCRKEHLEMYGGENIIRPYFNNVRFVTVDHLTEGQAMTCLLAKDLIPDDAVLTIGPSDSDMIYSTAAFDRMLENDDADGWVWTFRHNPAVLQNPAMYGWVRMTAADSFRARAICCKQPLSETPMEDHAVIGAFTFRKAAYFFDAVRVMVEQNRRINNEFYVDVAMDCAISLRRGIYALEVEQYICWGTPTDFDVYVREVESGKIAPRVIAKKGSGNHDAN